MSTVLKNLSGKENFKTIPAIRFDLLNGENSFLVNKQENNKIKRDENA